MRTITVYDATRSLLERELRAIRAHARAHPFPSPPRTRTTPTANDVWRRYVSAMITSQQRDSVELWRRLGVDRRWMDLRTRGPHACPSEAGVERLLRDNAIRFPRQKAERMCQGAGRDFEALARVGREVLRSAHDVGARREQHRAAEVRFAEALQDELGGCGVAPKIARLMMILLGPFQHVVPLDSRWQSALEREGAQVDRGGFSREATYRVFEDEIAEAAYDLRVLPVFADGAVFGWIDPGYQAATT